MKIRKDLQNNIKEKKIFYREYREALGIDQKKIRQLYKIDIIAIHIVFTVPIKKTNLL